MKIKIKTTSEIIEVKTGWEYAYGKIFFKEAGTKKEGRGRYLAIREKDVEFLEEV